MGQLTLQYGPLAHDFRRPYIHMKFEKPNLKTSYLSKMYSRKTKLTNWAIMWLIFWMNRFIMFLQFTFLRLSMITDWDLVNIFYIWTGSCSLILTISKKIIVTTFSSFVTSCLREIQFSNYVTYLLNEQTWSFHISLFWE